MQFIVWELLSLSAKYSESEANLSQWLVDDDLNLMINKQLWLIKMYLVPLSVIVCSLQHFLYLCCATVTNNAPQMCQCGPDNALKEWYLDAKSWRSKSDETTQRSGDFLHGKTEVVANRTCHPWPTLARATWSRKKSEAAKEEKEQLGNRWNPDGSCGRKCWRARFNSKETKNINSWDILPPQTNKATWPFVRFRETRSPIKL